MSTHEGEGISDGDATRKRTLTPKGRQYKLDGHFTESTRIVKRLSNQKSIIQDLLQSNNVDVMSRELAKLDNIHQSLLETYAQVRERWRNVAD